MKTGYPMRQRICVSSLLPVLLLLIVCTLMSGCATGGDRPAPYDFGKRGALKPMVVSRGGRFWPVDALGHCVFSMPSKLILWNWQAGSHKISTDEEQMIRTYLYVNELGDVKVSLNEYAPFSEFGRLWTNHNVGILYRGTVGMYFWLYDTLLPGRLLAGSPFSSDHYNPYTNTVHIYSGDPSLALQAVARAKAVTKRKHRGTYAITHLIPGVDYAQDCKATKDVESYYYWRLENENEIEGYKTLYPVLGTSPFQESAKLIGPLAPVVQMVVTIPTAVIGHISGHAQASDRLATQPDDPPCGQRQVGGAAE